jgi:hypothetical protein
MNFGHDISSLVGAEAKAICLRLSLECVDAPFAASSTIIRVDKRNKNK